MSWVRCLFNTALIKCLPSPDPCCMLGIISLSTMPKHTCHAIMILTAWSLKSLSRRAKMHMQWMLVFSGCFSSMMSMTLCQQFGEKLAWNGRDIIVVWRKDKASQVAAALYCPTRHPEGDDEALLYCLIACLKSISCDLNFYWRVSLLVSCHQDMSQELYDLRLE